MDAETLEALKKSIKKWEAIVEGTGEDMGAENCALCSAFPTCEGCPVAEKTEQDGCDGTPYYTFLETLDGKDRDLPRKAVTKTQKRAAQKELDFLRSLLPSP